MTINNYGLDERLINTFINFYGEENREYILKKFQSIKIIWYNDNMTEEPEDITKHIVTNIPSKELNEILSSRNKSIFLQSGFIAEFNLLILPQSGNVTRITHETNHMVSGHLLSLQPLKMVNGISSTFEKTSNIIVLNEFLNEVINQLMVIEILSSLNIQSEKSWQENVFPLVKYFYESFKNDLKELYITGDLSRFIAKVGEENFDEFSQIIHIKAFKIRRKLARNEEINISDDDISYVEALVNAMKVHKMKYR